MKSLLTCLLLLPILGWSQNQLTGQVRIHEEGRNVNISHRESNEYRVKTSRNKKGKLKTEVMHAAYQLYKDEEEIASGTTSETGRFEINDLGIGSYWLKVRINSLLNKDTLIEVATKRTKVDIEIDQTRFWTYIDSTQIAKYPFTKELALEDMAKGEVKILTSGLPFLPLKQLNSIASKYGFKYEGAAGCIVNTYETQAIDNYNQEVYKYLDSINAPGWKDEMRMQQRELLKKRLSTNLKKYKKSYRNVFQQAIFANIISEIEDYKEDIRFIKGNWEQLTEKIVQTHWQLSKKEKEKKIGLITLSMGQDIIYSEVYNWSYDKELTRWTYETIQVRSDLTRLPSSFNPDHLSRQPYEDVFGYACYESGSIPSLGEEMLDLVEKEDIETLKVWIVSINPIRRGYAFLGLSLLEARSLEIDEVTKKKMNLVSSSRLLVNFCAGCTIIEYQPLTELLTEDVALDFIKNQMK